MRAETYAHKLKDPIYATHSPSYNAHLLHVSFTLMQNKLVERGEGSLKWNGLAVIELNPLLDSHRTMQCAKYSITVVSAPKDQCTGL